MVVLSVEVISLALLDFSLLVVLDVVVFSPGRSSGIARVVVDGVVDVVVEEDSCVDADIVGVFQESNRGLRGLEKFYQGRDSRHG